MTLWAPHPRGHARYQTVCGRGLVEKLRAGAYTCEVDGAPLKRPRGRKPIKFTTLRDARGAVEDTLITGSFTPPTVKERVFKTYDPEVEGYGNPDQWRDIFSGLFAPMEADEPYQVLGIAGNASWAEIKSAYRKQARLTHPDHGGTTEKFCRVREAFEILSARKEAA